MVYTCVKCGMSVIITTDSEGKTMIVRPCGEECGNTITVDISATVHGESNNEG